MSDHTPASATLKSPGIDDPLDPSETFCCSEEAPSCVDPLGAFGWQPAKMPTTHKAIVIDTMSAFRMLQARRQPSTAIEPRASSAPLMPLNSFPRFLPAARPSAHSPTIRAHQPLREHHTRKASSSNHQRLMHFFFLRDTLRRFRQKPNAPSRQDKRT